MDELYLLVFFKHINIMSNTISPFIALLIIEALGDEDPDITQKIFDKATSLSGGTTLLSPEEKQLKEEQKARRAESMRPKKPAAQVEPEVLASTEVVAQAQSSTLKPANGSIEIAPASGLAQLPTEGAQEPSAPTSGLLNENGAAQGSENITQVTEEQLKQLFAEAEKNVEDIKALKESSPDEAKKQLELVEKNIKEIEKIVEIEIPELDPSLKIGGGKRKFDELYRTQLETLKGNFQKLKTELGGESQPKSGDTSVSELVKKAEVDVLAIDTKIKELKSSGKTEVFGAFKKLLTGKSIESITKDAVDKIQGGISEILQMISTAEESIKIAENTVGVSQNESKSINTAKIGELYGLLNKLRNPLYADLGINTFSDTQISQMLDKFKAKPNGDGTETSEVEQGKQDKSSPGAIKLSSKAPVQGDKAPLQDKAPVQGPAVVQGSSNTKEEKIKILKAKCKGEDLMKIFIKILKIISKEDT